LVQRKSSSYVSIILAEANLLNSFLHVLAQPAKISLKTYWYFSLSLGLAKISFTSHLISVALASTSASV
jgi:hypothetical protein